MATKLSRATATRRPLLATLSGSAVVTPASTRKRLALVISGLALTASGLALAASGPALAAAAAKAPATTARPPADSVLETRALDLGVWDRIEVAVPAQVSIVIASTAAASIRAEPDVIDRIQFSVRDRLLMIRPSAGFTTDDGIHINLSTVAMHALTAKSAASVTVGPLAATTLHTTGLAASSVSFEHLAVDALRADLSASASLRVAGRARVQQLRLSGAANFNGAQLVCGEAQVSASGSASAKLDCRGSLDVRAQGAASVRYAGSPRVTQQLSGAASLRAL